jgi:parvulin-like peptidyl-prolyl isomerase
MGRTLASLALVGAWAMALYSQEVPAGKPAAVVNGEPVAVSDVKALLDQRPSPVPLTKDQEASMRKAALDVLIDDLLMRQYLRKSIAQPSADEIQKEMSELSDVLKKQNKTIQQFLKEGQQTEDQLRKDIIARLQWKSYLKAQLPEAKVKTYYDQNKVFFDKILVRASHILVKVKPNAPAAEKQAALARIQTIRQEVMSGKIDFAKAAEKYSDCPSKTKGGDIGMFPYKFMVVEPFARAAFALKVGDISDVVTTEFGLHIIKVTDRSKGEPSEFEKIKDSVRDMYSQDLDLYQNVLQEQRKSARIDTYLK